MSDRIKKLKEKVSQLYEDKQETRTQWADWLYQNHVFQVGEKAKEFAIRFNGDVELSEVGWILHDIADAVIDRFDTSHEDKSYEIATYLLWITGFDREEIQIVVTDILKNHGCRNQIYPQTREWKIVATADAVVHITTDFYDFAIKSNLLEWKSKVNVRKWAVAKINRDFHEKILFDDIRIEIRNEYNDTYALIEKLTE